MAMSKQEQEELMRLREENAKLKVAAESRSNGTVSIKVSEKGGVSVYGLGRFPVTFYQEQWHRLLELGPQIEEFIKANQDKLKVKPAPATK